MGKINPIVGVYIPIIRWHRHIYKMAVVNLIVEPLGNSSERFPPKFVAFCWLAANESTKIKANPRLLQYLSANKKEFQWLPGTLNNNSKTVVSIR